MRVFGRIVWAAQVWLTAVTTLIAGFPHVDCRCSDGRVKLLCLTSASAPTECCCHGSCCGSSSAGSAVPRATCPACHRHRGEPAAPGQVSSTCCARVLVQPETSCPTHLRTGAAADSTTQLFVLPEAAIAQAVEAAASWSDHHAPPPTDRVTVLCRLLI